MLMKLICSAVLPQMKWFAPVSYHTVLSVGSVREMANGINKSKRCSILMSVQGDQVQMEGLEKGNVTSAVSSNQSRLVHEYSDCHDRGSEASLLVSPLVVAGIVIGLVLLLSCVTIIVGSLRKDGRLRNPHLRSSYAPDGFSYGGSMGELRSACIEDLPPVFDFDSYVETLSRVNVMYPDSPPHYEECMGPDATQIYVPTDDPPPYSLTDPCLGTDIPTMHNSLEMEVSDGASFATGRLDTIASISLTALSMEGAPPYEVVVGGRDRPIPLIPTDLQMKHASADASPQRPITCSGHLARASSSPAIQE